MPMILKNISIASPLRILVQIERLTIANGEVLGVLGPSGSGKSSLLSYCAGVLDPKFSASGEIWIGKDDETRIRLDKQSPQERKLGLMFQDDLLFPNMSVGENLLFGMQGHEPRATRLHRVREMLKKADLEGYVDRRPTSLSGGQRSRVSLLRTLLSNPRALLLDEPFAKLDPLLRLEFRAFVFQCVRDQELPCLLVTHEMTDLPAESKRITVGLLSDSKDILR
ncbi:MAG: ABC transporter ATP-binding protein [Bdellovibrionales bacterium CG10_big_fil_rev_8_21_14_0_10_45_34]|nr:MAG: ABC transporter ATP-binding protein [Bdellovibrionales bacterium CG10_big_fil_rev_8_21_14_0_10_45_34]